MTDTRSQTRRPRVRLDARAWNQVRLVIDLAVLYIAAAAALVVDGRFYTRGDLILAALYPLVSLTVLRARGWASERLKETFVDTISTVVAGVSLATMLVIAAASIFHVGRPLSLSVRLWLYASVYLSVARYMLLIIRRRAVSGEVYATPTLIIGAGVIGSHLARRLLSDRSYGLRPVGLLDPDPLSNADQFEAAPVPVLGGLDRLSDAVRVTGARHVILAFSSEPDHLLAPKVRECQDLGVEVSLIPRMYESINERTTLDHVGGLPLLTLHTVDPHGWQFAVKHALDRTGAGIGLLFASPLLLVLTVLIKLSSPVRSCSASGESAATGTSSTCSSSARCAPRPPRRHRRPSCSPPAMPRVASRDSTAEPGSVASCATCHSTSCLSSSTCSAVT